MIGSIDQTTVIELWRSAHNLGQDHVAKACLEFAQANTTHVLEITEIDDITEEILTSIVSLDTLDISEVKLFILVDKWIQHNKPPQETISKLVSLIRFPMISLEDLLTIVKPSGIVPPEMRLEAFEFNVSPSSFPSTEKRFKPRGRLLWDPKFSTPGYTVNGDTFTATSNGTVIASVPLKPGRSHVWELEIVQPSNYMSFGVVQKGTNVLNWSGYGWDSKGWGWGFGGRHYSHNERTQGSTPKTIKYQIGDIIRVELSLDNALTFFYNDEHQGTHPNKPTGELYPAVACCSSVSVKLKSFSR